ncbi:hypothetical protein K227x_63320 [Rubripirellula lacrimiformis]|uniref:Uncharacterized protein n=2 Tax=Rubripirellula lacrimiformis TaxID=1930273 RepID=A0A517NLF9_9BACT|nr:hypothetical protein K227x_63320 [Rubripirellula lacrimiformis]
MTLESPISGPRYAPASMPIEPMPFDQQTAKASVQWLVDRTLRQMPRSFDGDKDWGNTKKVWAGVKVRMDGLKLKTNRRWREVEHGRWIQYEVTLPDIDAARNLDITIDATKPIQDLQSGEQRWSIDSTIIAPMKFSARIQRWNRGVKLFSVTVTGTMKLRLRSTATIGIYPDYLKIPPDLVIDPRMEQADLKLQKFEVDRVSHIGGDAAEAWGEIVQEVLVQRFVEKQDERLVSKLNKAIEKQRDDLKISMADWLVQLAQGSTE